MSPVGLYTEGLTHYAWTGSEIAALLDIMSSIFPSLFIKKPRQEMIISIISLIALQFTARKWFHCHLVCVIMLELQVHCDKTVVFAPFTLTPKGRRSWPQLKPVQAAVLC